MVLAEMPLSSRMLLNVLAVSLGKGMGSSCAWGGPASVPPYPGFRQENEVDRKAIPRPAWPSNARNRRSVLEDARGCRGDSRDRGTPRSGRSVGEISGFGLRAPARLAHQS